MPTSASSAGVPACPLARHRCRLCRRPRLCRRRRHRRPTEDRSSRGAARPPRLVARAPPQQRMPSASVAMGGGRRVSRPPRGECLHGPGSPPPPDRRKAQVGHNGTRPFSGSSHPLPQRLRQRRLTATPCGGPPPATGRLRIPPGASRTRLQTAALAAAAGDREVQRPLCKLALDRPSRASSLTSVLVTVLKTVRYSTEKLHNYGRARRSRGSESARSARVVGSGRALCVSPPAHRRGITAGMPDRPGRCRRRRPPHRVPRHQGPPASCPSTAVVFMVGGGVKDHLRPCPWFATVGPACRSLPA